jgi:cobalt/nickel transport system permease protein
MFSRWDARLKWFSVLICMVAVLTLSTPLPLLVALGLTLAWAWGARIPSTDLISRLGLLAVAFLPVLAVLPWSSQTWQTGLQTAVVVTLKGITVGLLVFILARTHSAAVNLAALQRLGVPLALVNLLQLQVRAIQILTREWKRIRVAMKTRAFTPRVGWQTYRSLGYGLGAVLVRGADHGERVSAAMIARGYTGREPLVAPVFRARGKDWGLAIFVVLVAASVAVGGLVL